jgi:N utilization substance protein B
VSAPASRRDARRTAFIVLYQWDVTGRPLASLYEGDVDPYAAELAEGVAEDVDELDRRITAASEGWPADRLGAVERSILRLAVYELDRGLAAPIAIDEAVRLAKRYATDEAGKLVNGVLGRIQREREVV